MDSRLRVERINGKRNLSYVILARDGDSQWLTAETRVDLSKLYFMRSRRIWYADPFNMKTGIHEYLKDCLRQAPRSARIAVFGFREVVEDDGLVGEIRFSYYK